MKLNVKTMCLCSMFSILIAVGAFIKVPISIVPVTLQTLFVVLAGMILGKRAASISVLIYIVIGLIGLPVFASGGGLGYILQPSFGYLLGFLAAAYLVGACSVKTKNMYQLIFVACLGMLVIYLIGILYFVFIQHVYYHIDFTLDYLLYYLFLVYLPGDLLCCILAGWIGNKLKNMSFL